MVLPLQRLCLTALRDSLKYQPNPYLHRIPPPNHRQNLRQDLLDLVLACGVISQDSAYTSLSSPEFLDGLTKLNTQRGITSDGEFLDLVAESLSVRRNGKTIGEEITELRLSIYTWHSDFVVALNLDSVVRVVRQCPNLKILHFSIVEDKLGQRRWQDETLLGTLPEWFDDLSSNGGLLNQLPDFAPCLSVLENVEQFSLTNQIDSRAPCLDRHRPLLNFRCLSSLRLAQVVVDPEAWTEFLMIVQNSLIELEADEVVVWALEEDTNWILPFPLPNLRSFTMEHSGPYTLQLIKNLMECPKLETVKMELRVGWEKEDVMRLLSQLSNVNVELGIFFRVDQKRDEYFDKESNFKLVNLFKEKIKKVMFVILRWGAEHSTALENLFANCHDLIEVSFCVPPDDELNDEERELVSNLSTAAVNSDLAPFLRDPSFVSKLRTLELFGPIDHAVLDALFENMANMERLTIEECPQLFDSHLKLWASSGGQPERLDLRGCRNITDDGLVPILISSGQRMKKCCVTSNRITVFTWRILVNHCPFYERRHYF